MRAALFGLALVTLVALGVWLTFFAPCEIYTFAPTGEIPGRCVMR